jgi:hypothetical protein
MAIIKNTTTNAGEDGLGVGVAEERRNKPLYTVIGSKNYCNYYGQWYGGSSKTKKRTRAI